MVEVAGVRVMKEFGGIKFINICDWLEDLFGNDWSKHPTYAETGEILRDWCEKNDAAYYAAPREDFSYVDAMDVAKTANKLIIVVEDLS